MMTDPRGIESEPDLSTQNPNNPVREDRRKLSRWRPIVLLVAQGHVPWLLVGALVGAAIFLTVLVRYARQRLRDSEGRSKTQHI